MSVRKLRKKGVNYAVMREAVTVQMTGRAPTVYYGDEAGVMRILQIRTTGAHIRGAGRIKN